MTGSPDLVASRVAVTVAYIVQGLSLTILVTRMPTIRNRLELSDGQLGLLLLLVPVVAAVGSVIAGTLSPRVGSKSVLRVAGPLVVLGVVGVGFSGSIWLTVVALVVFGVATGATDASMNMQATSVQHEYRRPIIASCFAWLSLAGLAGALLASGSAALSMPVGLFFLVCGIIVVPVQLVVGRNLLQDVTPEERADAAPVPWVPVLLIGLGLMCASVVDSTATNWSAVYLTDEVAAPEAIAALGYGIYSLVVLVTQVFVDRLDMRFGSVTLVRVGGVAGVIAVVIVAAAPSPTVALFGFALLGLSVAPIFPLAFTAGAVHDPDRSGHAVARINIFYYLGFLLGAPLVGVVAEFSRLRLGMAVIALAPLVVLVLARAFRANSV